MDRGEPELVDPADRGPEADRFSDGWGSTFELGWQIRPGDQLLGDLADHRAAADEWRHLLEQLPAPEEGADTRRPVHLVRGDGVEVGSEPCHVEFELRPGLGTGDDEEGAGLVREPRNLLDWIDRAEDIRDMGDADQLRPALEE